MDPGMIPTLHLPGEMMPGQFGPISRERRFCKNSQALTMSSVGMPSVMQTIRSSSASAASMMASAANGGGTKMTVAFAPVLPAASRTVLKIGQPSCVVPPLPGVTPPTICVPYAALVFAWNVPSRPVRPWTITRVFLSTRIDIYKSSLLRTNASGATCLSPFGHAERTARCRNYFVGPVFHGVGHNEVQSRLHQNFLAFVDVRSLQPQHDRQLHVGLARGFDHACCQRVDTQDAAENIDQHCLHALVAQQDFKGMRNLFGVGASAHVEKVR